MEKRDFKYFLAANSCQGFVSYFGDCYNPNEGWNAYIIKGGPGTGKSSFMKYVIKKAVEKGIEAIGLPCSSDPNSLDVVVIPKRKTVIMDGTAPHVVEPVYPGACESILNFGDFWDSKRFVGKEAEIIAVTNKNKALHKSASRYLQAAGQFLVDNVKIEASYTNNDRVTDFAKKLCKKYIPLRNTEAKENCQVRFLSGITPKGIITYPDTVTVGCKTAVIISDQIGSVSNKIMKYIKNYSLQNGYETIEIKNAFLPDILTDGIILPELSIAFIREYDGFILDSNERRIHARRFTDEKQMAKNSKRIKFNVKTANKLIEAATDILNQAKTVHDELEKYYIEAMDFNALNRFAEYFTKNLF